MNKSMIKNLATLIMVAMVISIGIYSIAAYRSTNAQVEYIYIPATEFDITGYSAAASVNGSHFNWSIGVGGQFTEISSVGLLGLQMTAADDVRKTIPFPDLFDPNYPVAVRVHYTSTSGDDDGGINWIYHTVPTSLGSAFTDIASTGMATTNGWDTVSFACDSSTVQYATRMTAWDTIRTADLAYYTKSKMWQMAVELNADGDAAGDELLFVGLEFAYVPRYAVGSRPDSVMVSGPTYGGVSKGIALLNKNR